MKPIIAILIGLFPYIANAAEAEGGAVTFSKYDPRIHLVSYDEQTHTHNFSGTIKLTGTLFLEFDMAASHRANGEINFQKFVPDPESGSKLPAVIEGFYPGPVRYLSLDAPLDQLVALFGGRQQYTRLSHGTAHEISKRAVVVVRDYVATIECDARAYGAHVISVAALKEPRQIASREAPHGC
jgi:hypothetical protein